MRLIPAVLLLCSIPAAQAASVPFIGCKSDGQMGPLDVPKGEAKIVELSPDVAAKLAWYEGPGQLGVLGPRGWNCFFGYGSGGSGLLVRPEPFADAGGIDRFEQGSSGFSIDMESYDGETGGRFTVATLISRVFPRFRKFTEYVRDLYPDLEIAFPAGPFATDKLRYQSPKVVAFETPSQRKGLGTEFSVLRPSATPISGVATLIRDELQNAPSAIVLSIRLPASLRSLAPVIVREAEREATASR